MTRIFFIALAGALGTVTRYGLGNLVQRFAGSAYPWGTALVNVLGCLVFGVIWAMSERLVIRPDTRVILLTGFLGSFTTFSAFSFETVQLMRDAQWSWAAGNVIIQVLLGVAAIYLGLFTGRQL